MKSESAEINRPDLLRLLRLKYGIDVERLVFIPKGEESYGYMAVADSGYRYFIKLHTFIDGYDERRSKRLETPYRMAHQLHTELGLHYVVAPLTTVEHEVICNWGKFAVVVFPFVVGDDLDDSRCTVQEREQMAAMIAAFHKDTRDLALLDLPEEDFAISFKGWLLDVMAAADELVALDNEVRQQVRALLKRNKSLIVELLQDLETAGERAKTVPYDQVLTHGDLASGNVIKATDGQLCIIDWGKLLRAPAERDLVSFWETDFDSLLALYREQREPASNLSIDILKYYVYSSILAQVADYGSWILLEDAQPDDLIHAWRQLKNVVHMAQYDVQSRFAHLRLLIQA